MARWNYTLGLLTLSLWATLASAGEFRIAGYLPEYRVKTFDSEAAAGLTDLIVFSAEPGPDSGIDATRLKDVPWEKLQEYKAKHHARLILGLGGWKRSGSFAEVVVSPEKRKILTDACLKFCQERKLDGVDLDWEYPEGEAQEQGYGELISEIHKAFAPHKLLVSATISASQKLPAKTFADADFVQVMSYDHAGKHSTYDNAVADVETLLERGIPAEKIVLGIPFYGLSEKRDKAWAYREVLEKFSPKPDVEEVEGIFFNGPGLVQRKTNYALDSKLGGVMMWELGQDAAGDASLVKLIRKTVDARK